MTKARMCTTQAVFVSVMSDTIEEINKSGRRLSDTLIVCDTVYSLLCAVRSSDGTDGQCALHCAL